MAAHRKSEQGELFPTPHSRTAHELASFLNDGARHPVDLVITRNRVSMVSAQFDPTGRIKLRLHEGFLAAPDAVVKALRTYLRTRRHDSWRVVRDYAQSIPDRPARQRARRLVVKGQTYDLADIRDAVNTRFFGKRLRCRIGWGARRSRRRSARTRTIRFGSYIQDENLVLVSPRLDTPDVPREFVEYIVYHEMLHAVVPSLKTNGRWAHHPPAFRALEKRFPDWDRMQRISRSLVK